MVTNNNRDNNPRAKTSLPGYARLPVNHCNLPSIILGSLSFQHHPTALFIDGVYEFHKKLFSDLITIRSPVKRASYFMDYMTVHFRMHKLEEVGAMLEDANKRINADYLRVLRGWLFDADSMEAAVLKSWVESRFGLLTRHHKGDLGDYTGVKYQLYIHERSRGLYATNALEAQFDLLYSYCQYELALSYAENHHIKLYRGVNRVDHYEMIERHDKKQAVVLLNNLNSFTSNRERADEFGDYILEADVPWQKILFYSNLLPGMFSGEEEIMVIGGVYKVNITL
jgi:NAD+--dinitrogen-reductase ADP-D-ribosyltransferase